MKLQLIPCCLICLICLSSVLLPAQSHAEMDLPRPSLNTYSQSVHLQFESAEAAQAARVRLLPLPGDSRWAISCRWDDNTMERNLQVLEVMQRSGMKGTWFLNGSPRGEIDPRALLEGGQGIGVHGWSHAYFGALSRNACLSEMLQCRAYLEAASDTPVQTAGFAYIHVYDQFEGSRAALDSTEVLFRSGINGFASLSLKWIRPRLPAPTMLSVGVPYPGDSSRLEKFTEAYADEEQRQRDPGLVFGLHAWSEVDRLDELAEVFALATKDPEVWICTVDEYVAYRHQWQQAKPQVCVQGDSLILTIQRPHLRELGRAVPLEFVVEGATAHQVLSCHSPQATVSQLPALNAWARYSLTHDQGQQLPRRIAWIPNPDNAPELGSAPDMPEVKGALIHEGARLQLRLQTSEGSFSQVQVSYRLPLAFEDAPSFVTLADGPSLNHVFELSSRTADFRYHHGDYFFGAQVDALLNGEAVRIHLTSTSPSRVPPDNAYPIHGFLRTGPIPFEVVEMKAIERFATENEPSLFIDGQILEFSQPPDYSEVARMDGGVMAVPRSWLDAGKVPLLCSWDRRPGLDCGVYVYVSSVESPVPQPVEVRLDGLGKRPSVRAHIPTEPEYALENPGVVAVAAWLNGELLALGHLPQGQTFPGRLAAGANRLVVVFQIVDEGLPCSHLYGGVGLTLCAADGTRLQNISYHPILSP